MAICLSAFQVSPIHGQVTCRHNITVYADGAQIAERRGGYRIALNIELPTNAQILAIKCTKEASGGILASLDNGVKSDRDWMCTDQEQVDDAWTRPDYNDNTLEWETAGEKTYSYGNIEVRKKVF